MPYIDVNQKRLNYSDSHPNGPPAGGLTYLFIHGLGSSQNYYGGVIPHLTSNHRCIAIDTYGSGRSTFTGLDQSIDTIADDAVKVMDGLKVSKAVLVGHSMGGTTVLQFAAKYGDRLVAVVAIGPVHPTADGMEPMANTIPNAATGSKSTALQKAFIRELILSQSPGGYISLCKVISEATAPDYAAIKAPLLIIAGAEDKAAPLEGCKHIIANVSSTLKTLDVLPGVGHWHCIEASDEIGNLILKFTRSHRG
ncbi:Alpha/beta hydrolase fold-1 [Penicillium occitanis (nom. inval.)]|nr:Alpha/beta hydrolase fold-1 [Penicillium occitanis (nom. inval.)]PCH09275.1 hypothetical protein PENOC_010590 [Penicillium occitanis (nom. inval.)]